MNRCINCGCWDPDYETCTMPSTDKWYACPIESEKPENQEELRKMAEWYAERDKEQKNDKAE